MTGTTFRPPGLAAFSALNFANGAMMRVCDPMLPVLAVDFAVTTGQAALTVSAYAITYGLMQLFYGPMGDRWGKRRVAAYAALASVPGNLLAIAAGSLDLLVVARVLSALAAAGVMPLILAWIGDTVPLDKRQAIMARFLSASVFGMIAGQWVSGVMTEWLGWRTVFASLAALYLVAGLSIARDGSIHHESLPHGSPGFVSQLRGVLSIRWARWVLAVGVMEGAAAFAGMTFLTAFLVHEFGLSLSAGAGVIALYGAGGLAYSASGAALVRRFGEVRVVGGAGAVLGAAWLAIASATHWWMVVPASLSAGFAFYAFHNAMQIHATQMAPQARGTAVALFAFFLFLGISSGVSAAAWVVDHIGYRPLFIGCGVALALIGAAFSRRLRRP